MSSEELHEDKALSEEHEVFKHMSTEELNELISLVEEEDLFSVFEKPNLVLKVGNKELHVKKEQLMKQSVVFEKMFDSDLTEAKTDEVSLSVKDPTTFCRFLRCLLPGFDDELTEDSARDILPLVHEYQADSLMKRIDTTLASFTKKNGNDITTDSIVQNILEAEHYDMPTYLTACINVASGKIHRRLTSNIQFSDVKQTTRFKICMRRISKIDSIYEKNRPIAILQPYMTDN